MIMKATEFKKLPAMKSAEWLITRSVKLREAFSFLLTSGCIFFLVSVNVVIPENEYTIFVSLNPPENY